MQSHSSCSRPFQNPEELCKNMPPFFPCASVCVCLFSPIDFPLFNLEFSWALVLRGGTATQTGQRKVGSLFRANSVSHMSSELPRTSTQDPSLPSLACARLPRTGDSAAFVPTASPALLGSQESSPFSSASRTTGLIPGCGEGGEESGGRAWLLPSCVTGSISLNLLTSVSSSIKWGDNSC